jgi:hypothetical protein
VVTDHVILRGRYTAVDVQLYGRAEYDPAAVIAAAVSRAAASGHPLPEEDVQQLMRMQQNQQVGGTAVASAGGAGAHGEKTPGGALPGPGAKRPRLLQAPLSIPLRPPGWDTEADGGIQAAGGESGAAKAAAAVEGALQPAPQLIPPGEWCGGAEAGIVVLAGVVDWGAMAADYE